jgi:hypothetical protein
MVCARSCACTAFTSVTKQVSDAIDAAARRLAVPCHGAVSALPCRPLLHSLLTCCCCHRCSYFGEQLWWWGLALWAVMLGQPWMVVGTAFNSLCMVRPPRAALRLLLRQLWMLQGVLQLLAPALQQT